MNLILLFFLQKLNQEEEKNSQKQFLQKFSQKNLKFLEVNDSSISKAEPSKRTSRTTSLFKKEYLILFVNCSSYKWVALISRDEKEVML